MPKRKAAKRKAAKCVRDPYKKLSTEDIRLAKMWHDEGGMDPSEIAELLRRDKSSMTRLLVMQKAGAHTVAHISCRLAPCPVMITQLWL